MTSSISENYSDPREDPERAMWAKGFVIGLAKPTSMYAPENVHDYLSLHNRAASAAWESARVGDVVNARNGYIALDNIRNSWPVSQMRQELTNEALSGRIGGAFEANQLADLGQKAVRLSDALGIMADTTDLTQKAKLQTGFKITATSAAMVGVAAATLALVSAPAIATFAGIVGFVGACGLLTGVLEIALQRQTKAEKSFIAELRTTQDDLTTLGDGLLDRLMERRAGLGAGAEPDFEASGAGGSTPLPAFVKEAATAPAEEGIARVGESLGGRRVQHEGGTGVEGGVIQFPAVRRPRG